MPLSQVREEAVMHCIKQPLEVMQVAMDAQRELTSHKNTTITVKDDDTKLMQRSEHGRGTNCGGLSEG
jgi:hypothetical protein